MPAAGSPRRICLVTSNGWGLGHLSREIAIALAVGDRSPVIMFSFSRGLPLASEFGISGEYCPSHTSDWIPAGRWNKYVQRRFELFLDEVSPDVVLFDGVAPYPGVLNALLDNPGISAGWLRRGMWQHGRTEAQLAKTSAFDFVIEPGDIAREYDDGPTAQLDAIRVPPVSLIEEVAMSSRAEAATELGLDPDRRALLFGLGSGQPGEARHAGRAALDEASRHGEWQIAMVSSPLASRPPATSDEGVQLRGVYPLMRYLRAFDGAISAAGYNSVHELIPAGVPSLFVPKSSSRTDDQEARARFLSERGLALMAADQDLGQVATQVGRLLDECGGKISKNLSGLDASEVSGGAGAVAQILLDGTPTGNRDIAMGEWRQPGWKGALKRAIGPRGVTSVQKVLGRSPPAPPRRTVSRDPNADMPHLLFDEDVTLVSRSQDQPVEHLLPGSSTGYRRDREALIEEFYDLT
jgi:UDP:flavonoid glycosyltransferase YjiC (YdhE family)